MRRAFLYIFVLFLFYLLTHQNSRADILVADISEHSIHINLGFTGKKVLLYGAYDGDGEIVALVKGPPQPITIRRKAKFAGIWANEEFVTFENAISFYQLMASKDLDEWLPLKFREQYQIGVEYLNFTIRENVGPAQKAHFQTALIRNKQRLGHYGKFHGNINILGGRLFRTEIYFPANVPTGDYILKTFLIRDGKLVTTQNTPLYISKSGIEAEVYKLAHNYPRLYGIIAIIIAVAAGLAANAGALRR